MKKDQQFFVVQKAFIDKGGEVLVLNDPIEGLDFPGGKIQEGETDLAGALKREVYEETGLIIEIGKPFEVGYFEFPLNTGHRNAGKKVYLVGFKCKYISGEVKLSDEHNKFLWVNSDNYKEVDDHTVFFKLIESYFRK